MMLVTGGCGFIGSNFILDRIMNSDEKIINLDSLTYAGDASRLASLLGNKKYEFIHGSINDRELVENLFKLHSPQSVVHFAAESHVDRSINSSSPFIETNVNGTLNLLQSSLNFWLSLDEQAQKTFRFINVSTDEVYGSLEEGDSAFTEHSRYLPNSPYAASKASSDHLARAFFKTYGLPTIVTNCSNNYGPMQHSEKLIPVIIINALKGVDIPIYGDGRQIRDWIHVKDHCDAISTVLEAGYLGENYNIGGDNELPNLTIVKMICELLDEMQPKKNGSYFELTKHVSDRLGHDRRYAVDASRLKKETGWQPKQLFLTGLRETVGWYIDNHASFV